MSNVRAISLGIHIGHDSACAVAIDGALVAAVQQERITRRKYDGQTRLSDRLPIREVLDAAGVAIDDVQRIISSHQSAAPGGIGFGRELADPDFSAFPVSDSRHIAISHHLAHAYSVAPYLDGHDCAILISDLGGSTTHDGSDYAVPFSDLEAALRSSREVHSVQTECLSIYRWELGRAVLVEREFAMPHSEPDCFVFSPASLYDNASQSVFQKQNCYGQLMALASYGKAAAGECGLSVDDICRVSEDAVSWLNGWQTQPCTSPSDFDMAAAFAAVVQRCTEEAVLAYARRVRRLTGSKRLAIAGGLFLNINSNSRLALSGLFEQVAVPSAPGDAGIAVGCAMYGQASLGFDLRAARNRSPTDRLGPIYSHSDVRQAVELFTPFIDVEPLSVSMVASELRSGQIVARWSGRSEFGPRALGGRSLLASPLIENAKDRLNAIKGRQSWRPVAPVVLAERFTSYFEGPSASPFMNFLHYVRPQQRSVFLALRHPDHSTRAQTLDSQSDPELRALLLEFERLTGYAVLVNTSLNGQDEPIVETPTQALKFFVENVGVDALVLEGLHIRRAPQWDEVKWRGTEVRLASDCVAGRLVSLNARECRLYRGLTSIEISDECLALVTARAMAFTPSLDLAQLARMVSPPIAAELYNLLEAGWLEWRYANT